MRRLLPSTCPALAIKITTSLDSALQSILSIRVDTFKLNYNYVRAASRPFSDIWNQIDPLMRFNITSAQILKRFETAKKLTCVLILV